ncbi:type II secretion system F family protein [Rhodosalinus sp. 5P4]|uniref:type II secretion system F family protein n=1 Tax=Rhodosalinus sp. 5P4 TaxID=3239196 RepID=UPI0035255FD6
MKIDLSFLGLGEVVLSLDTLRALLQPSGYEPMQLMLYAGIFLGVLVAFEGLRQALSAGEDRREARNRRMRMIEAGKSPEDILALLKPEPKTGFLARLPLVGNLPVALSQAGIAMSPRLFVLAGLSGFAVFASVSSSVLGPLPGLSLAACLFLLLPLMFVGVARQKRMDRLTQQLPDALELMARGLKVGHPLNTTIRSVAEEMNDPIASEFGIVVDQIIYGQDLPEAFAEMAQRVGLEDAHYLSTSISIQHGSGGDLSRVLLTLSRVIRSRLTLRRKVHAISAEGRLSALLLSFLPVAIFSFTMITAPSFYGDVMDDPLFKPLAMTVVALVLLNAFVLYRLVNFRF